MKEKYRQLTLYDRRKIEEGLNVGESFRSIASAIGKSPSTVSREVRQNRMRKGTRRKTRYKCRWAQDCDVRGLCERCSQPAYFCYECPTRDCKELCSKFQEHIACERTTRAPWVCNACRHKGICSRETRHIYIASAADGMSSSRRSETRRGIDMPEKDARRALAVVKDALSRGMSPYEISKAYKGEIGRSESTIYRWTDAGYGGLCNIELERKVKFKPRNKTTPRKPTSHDPRRAYSRFEDLSQDARDSACEMDTVLGFASDIRCALTLYLRPCHFQFALLLEGKTEEEVCRALGMLKGISGTALFDSMFSCVLTDNGTEFEDEQALAEIFGEKEEDEPRLFYCDVRQSQQKGSCEKNHTEIRQILKKGLFSFDELTERDLACVMSHANSNPRRSLCGMSPIDMLVGAYGDEAEDMLCALGVEKIEPDELLLKPSLINREREARGEELLDIPE